ncbi:MAG: 6-carboxytetrahydropterin synthase QueD [Hydrococcus sp. Prado102]|jgi:6-pyruvoyltetrahydropterin/6-carboxytetrahydropterin synthase|nr:6-carboxytetrahydropterin synthase QueD [Hydrococcus sp. Prado102]
MWILTKEFTFEASHLLPHHDGKCARLHGHSWKGSVYVAGDKLIKHGAKQGMLIDYATIKQYLNPLIENYLDHWHLNDTTKLESPTSERLVEWIFNKLQRTGLPGLIAVEIQETCTSRCIYYPKKHSIIDAIDAANLVEFLIK